MWSKEFKGIAELSNWFLLRFSAPISHAGDRIDRDKARMGIEAESKEEGQREEGKDLFGIHGSTPPDQTPAMPRTGYVSIRAIDQQIV